jgi:hypothetical protein
MYGQMNQLNTDQKGYNIGGAPGPSWGLDRSSYDTHVETPSVKAIYNFTPTLLNELTLGVNHWDEPGGPLDQTQCSSSITSSWKSTLKSGSELPASP